MKRLISAGTLTVILICVIASVKSVRGDVAIEVDTFRVYQDDVHETILASGNLMFAREVQLKPQVIGQVMEIHVEVGQLVEQGQLLMNLDPRDHQTEVDQMSASLAVRSIEIERIEELLSEAERRSSAQQRMHDRGFIDDETYRRLESEIRLLGIDLKAAQERYRQDQALLDQRMQRLSRTQFHAPISGLITDIDVAVGETVVAAATNMVGSSLMTIADPESYVARIRVDEADITSVSIGQAVNVFAAASPGVPAEGEVSSIALVARRDARDRGLYYEVEVALSDFSSAFPGMSCRAELVTARSEGGLTVPVSAISAENGEHFVWVVVGGRAHRRAVTPGLASDTRQSILTGINPDEIVIVGPARSIQGLTDGVEVTIGRG